MKIDDYVQNALATLSNEYDYGDITPQLMGMVLGLSDESGEVLGKDKIIEPPSFVSLGEITGSSSEVIISGKTQPSDQWAVISEMRRRLHETFEAKDIKLAISPLLQQAPRNKRR